MRFGLIHPNVSIGENSRIGEFVEIGIPPEGETDGKLETIIGNNSIIRSHTIIYTLIGADSLVTKNIPNYAVAFGHPTQVRGDIRGLLDDYGNPIYNIQ